MPEARSPLVNLRRSPALPSARPKLPRDARSPRSLRPAASSTRHRRWPGARLAGPRCADVGHARVALVGGEAGQVSRLHRYDHRRIMHRRAQESHSPLLRLAESVLLARRVGKGRQHGQNSEKALRRIGLTDHVRSTLHRAGDGAVIGTSVGATCRHQVPREQKYFDNQISKRGFVALGKNNYCQNPIKTRSGSHRQ